uniref:GILT-like protein n=2 Tax=Caenorhabditis japonica TaxID=281687 RepID=A0A8R1IRR3_CAEJA
MPSCSLIFSLLFFVLQTATSLQDEGGMVNIVAFGEARCSDTSYWMKWHWLPMWRMLGSTGRINFEYHPFGIKTTCVDAEDSDDVVCDCHHGAKECVLNQLQNCVIEALPNFEQYMEIVTCIQGKSNITVAADACFNEPTLDRHKMVECAESRHGRKLFSSQEEHAAKLAPDMDWVPWILINGKRYKQAEDDLWQFLCDRFIFPRPIHCPKKIVY